MRKIKTYKILAFFTAITCFMLISISSADTKMFVLSAIRIDQTMQPKSLFTVIQECNTNQACKTIINSAGEYFGVPTKEIFAVNAILNTRTKGEESYFDLRLPNGYSYCKASMIPISVVPYDGDRGSTFAARSVDNGVNAMTWTPVLALGKGRSWVEARIEILGVRTDSSELYYKAGKCNRPKNRLLWNCRGGGCTITKDRGQDVPSDTPGAGENKR